MDPRDALLSPASIMRKLEKWQFAGLTNLEVKAWGGYQPHVGEGVGSRFHGSALSVFPASLGSLFEQVVCCDT